ncbi:MAG: hypothetical protein LC790_21445, partial [Actinobacteria bacterium]|nr:hypothetical protein [Actinomycetota bacterium]
MRACFRRRPQAPPALITFRAKQSPTLSDLRLRQTRQDISKPIRLLALLGHTKKFAPNPRTPLHN